MHDSACQRLSQGLFEMAKARFRAIEDDVLYTCDELREILGKSMAEVKRFVREQCVHSEPWEGCLMVLGLDFKNAVIGATKVDTVEAKAERRRKSGAASRTKESSKTP